MDLKGSQTEKNLLIAFAGESQARNRYDYWSSQAKKDGYVQFSQIFSQIALQEKEHAERFFKFLEGGEVEITASYPAGEIGTTLENLQAAAAGEEFEFSSLYPGFADVAKQEGFNQISAVFKSVIEAEKEHNAIFNNCADQIKKDIVFKREERVFWRCLNCGYIHEGDTAPEECPACAHPRAYFQRWLPHGFPF
ncbi:MAG: rubrerythrin family protein [Deltaproteobacteria bacterium]|nr:rubrerythrin family protein [Deltaproteobacteria bacterium]